MTHSPSEEFDKSNIDSEKIKNAYLKRIASEKSKALSVSVMGQTGVGKSSLINALFGTQLKTDPVRPCTREVETVEFFAGERKLAFHDLPGIGESPHADIGYIKEYRRLIVESDVVLWVLHADSRSVVSDQAALVKVLGNSKEANSKLISKLTFVLNKVDLIQASPWTLEPSGKYAYFNCSSDTDKLLALKAAYFRSQLTDKYASRTVSSTYNGGEGVLEEPEFTFSQKVVEYHGMLSDKKLLELVEKYPKHSDLLDRLADNYRVIPVSARYKFNLSQLLSVIANKASESAIYRLDDFVDLREINRISLREAVGFRGPRYKFGFWGFLSILIHWLKFGRSWKEVSGGKETYAER